MRPLTDYSHIRGFNYTASYAVNDMDFWSHYKHDVVEKEMGYAKRLGLNAARIFLPYRVYLKNKTQFLQDVKDFVQTAWKYQVWTSPIVYFGYEFYPDFVEEEATEDLPKMVSMLDPDNYYLADQYFDDLHAAIGSEEGLIFWDVANEPGYHTPNFVTFYPDEPQFRKDMAPLPEDMDAFREKQERVWKFIRHAITHMKETDPVNALGVGNTFAYEIEPSKTAEMVDILIYHDYFETRKRVRTTCELMKNLSIKYGKPVINNETGCLCRSNPYDMVLEILNEYKFGFFVFELMVGSSGWQRVHGIVYPDGTVRDPSIVAAVQGFFRNRGESALPENVNEEGHAFVALKMAAEAISLSESRSMRHQKKECAEILLEAAEYIANLLEAGQYVPMRIPPTAKIAAWRRQENPNLEEIRQWLFSLMGTLKEVCYISGNEMTDARM